MEAAAVRRDDGLDEGESEPVPGEGTARVRPPEARVDVGEVGGGNAAARVGDDEAHALREGVERQVDASAARRILDGVLQKVPDELLELGAVAGEGEPEWYSAEQRRKMAVPSAFEKANSILREWEGE